MSFFIDKIEIGLGCAPLVIPEIGINHGGSLKIAMEIVDSAYRAGAKIVKHQTHIVEDEMSSEAKKLIPGNANVSIYEIMKRCALCEDEERELKNYVESKGMFFFSTPFSRAAAKRLEKFDVKAYKIGSGELNNYPLLEYIASIGRPMIVSTGMNDMASISKAVNILERKNVHFALMHTTNLYPTAPYLIRLGAIQQLMKEFKGIPIGLSDHSLNNNACIAAIALGANLVERHFTDRMDRKGPDIICSMDEQALVQLLNAAEQVSQMLGGEKKATEEEKVTIDFAFATVVTIRSVMKGEIFSKENIWVKRPGTGKIPAEMYNSILGKKAAIDIANDVHLDYSMIEG
jgi:sialic acid synthase SpsE